MIFVFTQRAGRPAFARSLDYPFVSERETVFGCFGVIYAFTRRLFSVCWMTSLYGFSENWACCHRSKPESYNLIENGQIEICELFSTEKTENVFEVMQKACASRCSAATCFFVCETTTFRFFSKAFAKQTSRHIIFYWWLFNKRIHNEKIFFCFDRSGVVNAVFLFFENRASWTFRKILDRLIWTSQWRFRICGYSRRYEAQQCLDYAEHQIFRRTGYDPCRGWINFGKKGGKFFGFPVANPLV